MAGAGSARGLFRVAVTRIHKSSFGSGRGVKSFQWKVFAWGNPIKGFPHGGPAATQKRDFAFRQNPPISPFFLAFFSRPCYNRPMGFSCKKEKATAAFRVTARKETESPGALATQTTHRYAGVAALSAVIITHFFSLEKDVLPIGGGKTHFLRMFGLHCPLWARPACAFSFAAAPFAGGIWLWQSAPCGGSPCGTGAGFPVPRKTP